ncbi:hypothetical protein [Stutzerimonas azotifigens]|uniref:hypothetical protein n=1 Tax=Stutzerimonas azotifigens TaxID=291995 RepID=UPI0004287CE3|nr:hypothetical protein [Stutzerimonas azotifigens]
MRLMKHSGGTASTYKEFPGAEPASQAPRWALLQAVERAGQSAPCQPSAAVEQAPAEPQDPPAGLLAQLAASQPAVRPHPFAQPAPAEAAIQPPAEPLAVAAVPERSANPFGALFRTAPVLEEPPRESARHGSLKSLLKGIGTCR